MDGISALRVLPEAHAQTIRDLQPAGEALSGRARQVAAFADPTRLALAIALRAGTEVCVCDLSWIVARPVQLVSHHLGKMRAAGVVSSRKEGRLVMCTLTPDGVQLLEALAPGPSAAALGPSVRAQA